MTHDETEQVRVVRFPPGDDSWLSPKRVDYLAKFLQMILAAIAIPYLLWRFLFDPIALIRDVGEGVTT